MLSALAPPILPGVRDLAWLPGWAVAVLQLIGKRLILEITAAPGLDSARLGLPTVRLGLDREPALGASG